ncbi:hypothetical protein [Mucilaginibacter sp. dw_454]|uniref:hypothetical protein n=1 Tax=Mucilaginibacter sp. dw_454 TaxID=2720079 RepID=UPI001BD24ACE|nr:hypothetical protein [Mucilaginibacter sp. dw_454]
MKKIIGLLLITAMIAGCKKSTTNPGGGNGSGTGNGPGAATLLTPAKDEICTTGSVVSDTVSTISFTWNAVAKANTYDLTITNLLTQKATTQTISSTQATANLSRNTPYSWYVTSKISGKSGSSKSDVWKFYNAGSGIVTYAPYPAQIVAPTYGQIMTNAGGKVSLKWTGSVASGKLVGYNVYFGPSNNPDLFRANITDNFLNDISVSANTTYYWHIITVDSNGNSSDSGLYNFFVQ